MTQADVHRAALATLTDWTPYLDADSGLPGPRANLELVAACSEEANADRARDLIATGDEFATVCGLVAPGRHVGQGDDDPVATVARTRAWASSASLGSIATAVWAALCGSTPIITDVSTSVGSIQSGSARALLLQIAGARSSFEPPAAGDPTGSASFDSQPVTRPAAGTS